MYPLILQYLLIYLEHYSLHADKDLKSAIDLSCQAQGECMH